MPSKEEIEEAKGWLAALDVKSEYEATSKEIILSYIEQLEVEKIEVIEKDNKVLRFLLELKKELTEELKYNSTKREARLQLSIVDKILELIKGE